MPEERLTRPHRYLLTRRHFAALAAAAGAGCSRADPEKSPTAAPSPAASVASATPASPAASAGAAPVPEEVSFPSGERTLRGYLFKPEGPAPYPTVVWNHGSEKEQRQRLPLARTYLARGYALFLPHRRGHGLSPGEYIVDQQTELATSEPDPARRARKIIGLQEAHLEDTLAAVAWAARQPFVDRTRIAVSGSSFGGIQTVLAAERESEARAFVAFAPAAMSWQGNPALRERLVAAAAGATRPLFVLQAENDYDLGPSTALGAALAKKGELYRAKVFPPYGDSNAEGHGAFAIKGGDVWGPDVFAFLEQAFRAR